MLIHLKLGRKKSWWEAKSNSVFKGQPPPLCVYVRGCACVFLCCPFPNWPAVATCSASLKPPIDPVAVSQQALLLCLYPPFQRVHNTSEEEERKWWWLWLQSEGGEKNCSEGGGGQASGGKDGWRRKEGRYLKKQSQGGSKWPGKTGWVFS